MLNRLIKTEKDYNLALSRIEELMDAQKNTPEADELELLAALVEMYEDEHYPMDLPDPVDALKFRMEQLGLNQQGLVPFIGSRSKVSEVLNRKKPLTLAMFSSVNPERIFQTTCWMWTGPGFPWLKWKSDAGCRR